MITGLEQCARQLPDVLRGRRFGLVTNQAAVDGRFRGAEEVLAAAAPGGLVALFSPQHGFWSTEQDNMVETPDDVHPRLGVPIHSLYEVKRRPDAGTLADLDALVVDLQDVGTRVYTYIWTLSLCLEACARAGVRVVVLDRPNPLGGRIVEGPRLDPAFASFVGRAAIPMRHALSIGEIARWLDVELAIGAGVDVVPLEGWSRGVTWRRSGRPWVPPSPNLPRVEGVELYAGTVLLEGTNLSEGRGTTTPFELVGAPYVDPWTWERALCDWELPGLALRPVRFRPTFQKWCGETCGGLFLHALEPDEMRPYRTAVALIATAQALWPDAFAWRAPPYEYEERAMPIDILSGSDALRRAVDAGGAPRDFEGVIDVDAAAWWDAVRPALLYETA